MSPWPALTLCRFGGRRRQRESRCSVARAFIAMQSCRPRRYDCISIGRMSTTIFAAAFWKEGGGPHASSGPLARRPIPGPCHQVLSTPLWQGTDIGGWYPSASGAESRAMPVEAVHEAGVRFRLQQLVCVPPSSMRCIHIIALRRNEKRDEFGATFNTTARFICLPNAYQETDITLGASALASRTPTHVRTLKP